MTHRILVVGELMSPAVVTIGPNATVAEADEEMRRSDCRHLPVVDAQGHVAGLVSDRDLLPHRGSDHGRRLEVSRVMTQDVLTVQPETPAREASLVLLEHKIGSVVVVDREGKLRGVLTENDFVRVAHEVLGGDRLAVDEG
jgi:CBS domain-containing protein